MRNLSPAEMGNLQAETQELIKKYIQREVNKFYRDTDGLLIKGVYVGSHHWFTADGEGTTIGPVNFEIQLP